MVQTVQILAVFPQLQFIGKVVDIPVAEQRLRRWFSTFPCIQQSLVRCCALLRSEYLRAHPCGLDYEFALCFLGFFWRGLQENAAVFYVGSTVDTRACVSLQSLYRISHIFYVKVVACAWLVLLVTIQFALCSLLLSSGPRCSASWWGWTRRTVIQRDRGRARRRQRQSQVYCWFFWVDALRAVFFVCRQARDARHHFFAVSRKWPRSTSTTAVAWYVLVMDAPVVVLRQVPGLGLEVVDGAMSMQRQGSAVRLTAEVPQLRSSTRS